MKFKKTNKYGYLLVVLFLLFFSYFLFKNMSLLVDSDMSSELVLSKLLSEEKTILSKNWYYSTELRVFNTQYIFVPLFWITNNYHLVRIIGTIILDLILLASFIYSCKQLKVTHIPFFLIFIIGPFSKDYFDFFIKAPHYIPYTIICFLTLGLLLGKHKNARIAYLMLFVTAFVSSMNGVRQLTVLYLPLFCTTIFELLQDYVLNIKKEESKAIYIGTYISFLGSLLGYLIYSRVLSPKYEIISDQWSLVLGIPKIEKIKDVIYGWISSFGYTNSIGYIYERISLVISIVLLILVLFACISVLIKPIYTRENKFLASFTIISFGIMSCVFLFTDMTVITRYFSINAIMSIFVVGIYFSNIEVKKGTVVLASLLFIFVVSNSFVLLNDEIQNTNNKSLLNIEKILLEKSCVNGYAPFWESNVLTEMSDGKIETWTYRNNEDCDLIGIVELKNGNWLQRKDHFTRIPEGKIFVITNNDFEDNELLVLKDFCEYSDNYLKLFIFDNYEELEEVLRK